MNNRPERFRISSSDAAIQLDLVSKVNGIAAAEDYFNNLPNNLMDKRIYGALLNAYVRARMVEKAESLLVEMKKKESYKTIFPYIPNLGYNAVISSFIRMDDIEEAELLYEEWVSMKTSYDPRIGNLLLANSSTWEIIAEAHIKESRISDALSCFEKALAEEGSSFWRPKPMNISVLYNLCERENDEKSKEALLEVFRKVGVLEDDLYMSFLPFYTGSYLKPHMLKIAWAVTMKKHRICF
ncbi:Pentatricopeptide repeat-containing protein [Artemisia annua]|uniref:Pentatricopeptide repeat-containing protein n=1 Tax=Artemisia annua TaxID=35608 RepID=A0A2U1KP68_ARTAN|nr:Pentatricopeptide repeat-containing protein [Artemisia annua]